jgi:dihydroorotate dehydrogenase
VLEYLSVGATAVQVGTASFVSPGTVGGLVVELKRRIVELKINNMKELTEVLVPKWD